MTQNIRYALRTLAKQPAFAAIIIITFALGIGANTAVFSVLNAVLLRPLPFKEPEKIVALAPYDTRIGADNVDDNRPVPIQISSIGGRKIEYSNASPFTLTEVSP